MEEPPKQRKTSWKKSILWNGLPLILPLCFLLYGLGGSARLKQVLKEAEAIGGPVTLEQLMAARKTYPDDKNGANVILGIKDALTVIEESKQLNDLYCSLNLVPLGHRWSYAVDMEVCEFLDSMQTELAAIDTAKQYEGGRFPLIITPSVFDSRQPDLKLVRTACRLKHLQILNRAMRGDVSHLIDDLAVMLQISNFLTDEPLLISCLVRLSCFGLTIDTVEETCGVTEIDTSQLLHLQDILGTLNEGNRRMSLGMRGERAIFIGTMDQLRASANWYRRLVSRYDQAEGVRLYNRLVAATEQSRGIEESRVLKDNPNISTFSTLTKILFSPSSRAFVLDARVNAQASCAQVGMAVERYRIETGSFPARLDQLMPAYIEEIPGDPFKPDQPLKYVVKEDRVVIYSVGVDGNDNGGNVTRMKAVDEEKCDEGFILLFPEARNQPPLPPSSASAPSE